MKKRLLISAVSALAAMTVMSAGAAAVSAGDVVDFEDGGYSFASVDTSGGAGSAKLSVVDFNGSKRLKIDISDSKKETKVKFSINSLLDGGKFDSVKSIEMEIIAESRDGSTALGKVSGAVGTQGGSGADSPSWSKTTWEFKNDGTVSDSVTVQRKFIMVSDKLVNNTSDTYVVLVKSAGKTDCNIYVDNIRMIDSNGKAMQLKGVTSAAPAQTTAVTEPEPPEPPVFVNEEEYVEEPAETEAVLEEEEAPADEKVEVVEETAGTEDVKKEDPDSDSKTTSSTTGNLSAFAAASALVLSGYAVSMTRRRKKAACKYYSIG